MDKHIAIVHDWLVNFSGAEVVLEEIYKLFPGDVYTLLYDKDKVKNTFLKDTKIFPSFVQKLPFPTKLYPNYLPLFPIAIEQFDLSRYDIIISSSHCVAKGVLTSSKQLHICYCHTPMRYAWDFYHKYLAEMGINKGLKGILARYFLHKIRMWDICTSNRPDYYVANSKYIARRIKKIYEKEAEVIYPPVDIEDFDVGFKKENFYLVVSRLVPYKKIDLLVEAFNKMPDKRLIVIGDGPMMKKIKKIAGSNIEILGYQPKSIVKEYMKKAKALIFPAEEDFGIVMVEAQASGTPVIAYKEGGASEIVIENQTGLLFDKQNIYSIIDIIDKFERIQDKFDPYFIKNSSRRFDKEVFRSKFYKYVMEKVEKFFT